VRRSRARPSTSDNATAPGPTRCTR
jgi:hypothetical protein